MSSMTIKELGSVMSRNVSSAVGKVGQQTGSVSFESVWNNQTEKNGFSESEASDSKGVKKTESIVRDSLKPKDAGRTAVKESVDMQTQKTDEMNPEEMEEAMEVLGAAATELIHWIADAFDMTVDEVQDMMTDLGIEKLDLLQQGNLGELLLSAAGADSSTALLTDGELYEKYQMLIEQMDTLVEQCGEELQLSVQGVEELLDSLPIEITVEDAPAEEYLNDDEKISTEDNLNSVNGGVNNVSEAQDGNKTENQMNSNQEADDKGQNGNMLLQNLKVQNMEPGLQQVTGTTPAWDVDTLDIMKQIMDYMEIQVKPDVSSLEMQLHPESLGTLQVHVASKGGTVTAQFVTQNEAVKAVLESQMIQLKESFAEQGVKVDAVEVTVQTHQFEQNLEQGRGRQPEESDKKAKPRRIRLDGELTMEALEDMDEEELLAAQMMAANGGTVDYTA